MQIRHALFLFFGLAATTVAYAGSRDLSAVETPRWPEVWGDFGARGYGTGDRIAPNGVGFEPIFRTDFSLNLGLLPAKKLYLFLDNEFWAQRAAPGITNNNLGRYDFSKREFDLDLGLAWGLADHFELRASYFAQSNLNRGTSRTVASGYQDGAELEARYYFGPGNIYDTGRLSFVGLGYYPGAEMIGGSGSAFRAGLFAQVYLAYDIPALRSYLFGGARFVAEEGFDPRLIMVDGGLAVRPFRSLPNLEFRIGDEFTADVGDDTTRNLVYGAIRAYFGAGENVGDHATAGAAMNFARSPEVWGDIGFSIYPAGDRIAANGVEFTPIFAPDFNLNIGLLPPKKLYLFLENQFWIQRSSVAAPRAGNPANNDVNPREYDLAGGLAWNVWNGFEVRGSAYALNNLNRGGSATKPTSPRLPSGYQDGIQLEGRYYFHSGDIYDSGRQNFIGLGYYPAQTLIGGDGFGFHPSFFGRAAGALDLPAIRSYLYGDLRLIAQKGDSLRLVTFNGGIATRPFRSCENLEFRFGSEVTADVKADITRDLAYGAVRLNFSTR